MKEWELDKLIKQYHERRKIENIDKTVGAVSVLIGISILTSFVLSKYLYENIELLKKIQYIDKNIIIYCYIGSMFIIEGIVFYRNSLELTSLSNNKSTKNFFNSFVKSIFKSFREFINLFLPYIIVMVFGLMILLEPQQYLNFYNTSIHPAVMYNLIPIFFIFFEVYKVIKNLSTIFKQTIKDSKDRLSIVITILATIVSAIALLK